MAWVRSDMCCIWLFVRLCCKNGHFCWNQSKVPIFQHTFKIKISLKKREIFSAPGSALLHADDADDGFWTNLEGWALCEQILRRNTQKMQTQPNMSSVFSVCQELYPRPSTTIGPQARSATIHHNRSTGKIFFFAFYSDCPTAQCYECHYTLTFWLVTLTQLPYK